MDAVKHIINGLLIDFAFSHGLNAVFRLLPVSKRIIGMSRQIGNKQKTIPIDSKVVFMSWE
jgi:hypothetical protein